MKRTFPAPIGVLPH